MQATRRDLEGVFQYVIYSPGGLVEGALLHVDGSPVQLLLEREDEATGELLGAVATGQTVVADVMPQGDSPKGAPEHPVYLLERLRTVDGRKPARPRPARKSAYNGKVVRFNYARHGARNGVVLDTGDFVHTKPEGLLKLGLKLGDQVAVDGDAWPLCTGDGYVVEATVVNGKSVMRTPKG